MRKIFIVIILFESCAWILDKTPEINDLTGDYKIVIDLNQSTISKDLVLLDQRDDSVIYYKQIISNCTKIYFNSINMYVDSVFFDNVSKYSNIIYYSNHYDIKVITESEFDDRVSKCEACTFYNLEYSDVE